MVQRTLDATKTFIFDVRPMVLDDLGLVPTLRRASRDRGRRVGVDRRVRVRRRRPAAARRSSRAACSGCSTTPSRPTSPASPTRCRCTSTGASASSIELTAGQQPEPVAGPGAAAEGAELPPALAEMVERAPARPTQDAVEAARIASLSRLPEQAWREVAVARADPRRQGGDARRRRPPPPRGRAAAGDRAAARRQARPPRGCRVLGPARPGGHRRRGTAGSPTRTRTIGSYADRAASTVQFALDPPT